MAMLKLLQDQGITVAGLATSTATDHRVTNVRDIQRLSEKVAGSTQTPLEEISAILDDLFDGSYKQFFNKAENSVSGEASQACRSLDFARLRSKAGRTQSADVRQSAEAVPGQGNQNSVANEQPSLFSPDRLNDSTLQGYFDLPDVAVPIAKRAAAKKSIRAAGAVRGDDYPREC